MTAQVTWRCRTGAAAYASADPKIPEHNQAIVFKEYYGSNETVH
jgi:hypothetical protein